MSYIKKKVRLLAVIYWVGKHNKVLPYCNLVKLMLHAPFLNLIPLIFKPMLKHPAAEKHHPEGSRDSNLIVEILNNIQVFLITRWAPTIVINEFICPYKWVTGVFSPRNQWSLNLLK